MISRKAPRDRDAMGPAAEGGAPLREARTHLSDLNGLRQGDLRHGRGGGGGDGGPSSAVLLAGGMLLHGSGQQLRLSLRLLQQQLLLGWRQSQLNEIRTGHRKGRRRGAPRARRLLRGGRPEGHPP